MVDEFALPQRTRVELDKYRKELFVWCNLSVQRELIAAFGRYL
jgi:hypothetical protein